MLTFIELTSILILYHIIFIANKIDLKKCIIRSIFGGLIATLIFIMLKGNGAISFILIFILSLIVMSKAYNKNIIVNIVGLIIPLIIIIVIELVVMVISILIFGHNDLPYWLYFTILLVSMSSIIYYTYRIMRFRKINLENFIERYNSVFLISINLIIIFLFFKVLLQNKFIEGLEIVEIGVLFLTMIIINTFYFISLYRNDKENKKSELKQSINPLIQELLDEMKASEHEYKNHLNILYCMIQVCKEDELRDRAKKYIGNVFENKNLLRDLSYIENTILKGVLLSKINQAEKSEIICKYKIDSQLEGIALDDSELTVVLSNLLNNAIESASKSEKKYIDIFTTYQKGRYIIEVSNSVSNFTEDMISGISKVRFSTKGTGRGYGLYNINKIVNKYKGKINMSIKEDMFNISIEI
ncbi:MAG: GHKL domain-containing protein [Clostridium sp.]|nr:GHKL domain-containing protein [Clostridium sp.]MDO5780594.1 GHKL domain-containing protein [Clostridium sp.]